MNLCSSYTKIISILGMVLGVWGSQGYAQEASQGIASTHGPASNLVEANVEGDEPAGQLEAFSYQFPSMGTLVTLTAYVSDLGAAEAAFKQAEGEVARIAATLSDYDPASETRQLTESASSGAVMVTPLLFDALQASDVWFRKSGGAFDVSIGNVTRLWRKHARRGSAAGYGTSLPGPDEVGEALSKSGWRHVQLDKHAKSVRFSVENLRLDFGAIGKGIAVDAAFQALYGTGLTRCFVNISGNMRFGDPPPGRRGWRIEIAPISKGGPPIRRIEIANAAIATSGDLWQFVEVEGVRRSHILDPQTGQGVVGPVAATSIASTARDADAAATVGCIQSSGWLDQHFASLGIIALLVARPACDVDAPPRVTCWGDFPDPFDYEPADSDKRKD